MNRFKILIAGFAALAMSLVMFPLFALAAEFPIPEGDVAGVLLNLATNYKTMGVIGIVSALVLVTVQAVKAFVPEQWQYKRLVTLGVSIAYSIVSGFVVPGSNWVSVLVTVFLSSGGAVAIYEGLKGAGVIKSA